MNATVTAMEIANAHNEISTLRKQLATQKSEVGELTQYLQNSIAEKSTLLLQNSEFEEQIRSYAHENTNLKRCRSHIQVM